jgi:hypothetical protein
MSRTAILFTTAFLLAAPALAAPVPKGPKAEDEAVPFSVAKLLKHRKVQKELKMSAEQRITLVDAMEDLEEEYQKQVTKLDKMPNAPDEAYDKLDTERQKSTEKLYTSTADKSLTAAQRSRLRQIDWQLRGPAAFADAKVQKALQLSDAEKKAAAELAERLKDHAERYLDIAGDDGEAKVREEISTFRKDATKKFLDGLTEDQRMTWKAMIGEQVKGFDVEEMWYKIVDDEEDGHIDKYGINKGGKRIS